MINSEKIKVIIVVSTIPIRSGSCRPVARIAVFCKIRESPHKKFTSKKSHTPFEEKSFVNGFNSLCFASLMLRR